MATGTPRGNRLCRQPLSTNLLPFYIWIRKGSKEIHKHIHFYYLTGFFTRLYLGVHIVTGFTLCYKFTLSCGKMENGSKKYRQDIVTYKIGWSKLQKYRFMYLLWKDGGHVSWRNYVIEVKFQRKLCISEFTITRFW